jgi:Ser/Thr protein kinase RdoA (MazF antagonist)
MTWANHVEGILAEYVLEGPLHWEPVANYPHVYQVTAGSGGPSYYLKCYPSEQTALADIQAEVDLVNRLNAADVAVAAPIANRMGFWTTAVRNPELVGHAVLSEKAVGRTFAGHELSNRQCDAFGQLAARMHGAMDVIPANYPRRRMNLVALLDCPLQQIRPLLSASQYTELAGTADRLREYIAVLVADTATPRWGLCHGDLYSANVAFDDHDRPTLFDFQEAEYGWRSYDLAQFLWRIGHSWSDPDRDHRTGRWEAFLAGYNSVRSLSDAELQCVPAFVPLRLIWFMAFRVRSNPQSVGFDYFPTRLEFLQAWMRSFILA